MKGKSTGTTYSSDPGVTVVDAGGGGRYSAGGAAAGQLSEHASVLNQCQPTTEGLHKFHSAVTAGADGNIGAFGWGGTLLGSSE